ncbi:MAG: DUF4894 domain-containing protein [Fervidobacterium sp.]|nr:DUF4894 domain-containing protein [Fervidobacterium sp.]
MSIKTSNKRYRIALVVYTTLILWSIFLSTIRTKDVEELFKYPSRGENSTSSDYWFLIYYVDRFWYVNKDGKIYDLCQEYGNVCNNISPFVTGIKIDNETGELDRRMLTFIPKDIPRIIYEINLNEKYITTTKSAIIYFTDINDIDECSSVLKTVGDYLDSGKIFLFKNGKLYLL